ncbi:hypothetical protein [Calothrix sp. NIES-2098]|uniref:hypothetical protein n=1 Tax=Calothrix sp. NIES-2098 TaxID=1954171 RepID=UPI0030D92F20
MINSPENAPLILNRHQSQYFRLRGKGKGKKPLIFNLSPAETLRVACFPAGVHLFPKPNL